MSRIDPHQNLFFYYRGPTKNNDSLFDTQLEDNATKSLINILEFSHKFKEYVIIKELFSLFQIPYKEGEVFQAQLQVALKRIGDNRTSRPDASIVTSAGTFFIESKIQATLEDDQLFRHLKGQSPLIVITKTKVENKQPGIVYCTWSDIYFKLKPLLNTIQSSFKHILLDYLTFMEVSLMIEGFTGFTGQDFEYFSAGIKEGRELLKNKIDQFGKEVLSILKSKHPEEFTSYRLGRTGGQDSVWFAFGSDVEKVRCHYTIWASREGITIGFFVSKYYLKKFFKNIKANSGMIKKIIEKNFDINKDEVLMKMDYAKYRSQSSIDFIQKIMEINLCRLNSEEQIVALFEPIHNNLKKCGLVIYRTISYAKYNIDPKGTKKLVSDTADEVLKLYELYSYFKKQLD